MVRTFIFFLVLWISLFLSLILFLPYLFIFHTGTKMRYIAYWTRNWARLIVLITGSKVKIEGIEHIPENPDFIIISNHQGNMDVPILTSIFPYALSFIAKKELVKIPLVNLWLLALDSILIDRSAPVKSYHKLEMAMKKKRHNPIILFPEGTRSRKSTAGKNRKGGISLAKKSNKPILWVEISGSYQIWEEKKRIKPSVVHVHIRDHE